MRPLVLDTNIVLDLLVFADEAAQPLRAALHAGGLQWICTAPMRHELERVLGYPQIARRLQFHGHEPAALLQSFDALARPVAVPAKGPATCADPDDQKFIDLALAHGAQLLSKDHAVLSMSKRLARLGVDVATRWAPDPIPA